MPCNLYANLPVEDLARSVDVFAALGFSFNPKFTDENATCMIVNDNTSVMLVESAAAQRGGGDCTAAPASHP